MAVAMAMALALAMAVAMAMALAMAMAVALALAMAVAMAMALAMAVALALAMALVMAMALVIAVVRIGWHMNHSDRDPLSDNDLLIRACEVALQILMIRKCGGDRVSNIPGFRDPKQVKKLLELALNPRITREEIARTMGVSAKAIGRQLKILSGYLAEFVGDAHLLRSKDVGLGYAKNFDIEEKTQCQQQSE